MVSVTAKPNVTQSELTHRSVRMRLFPESKALAHKLAGTAGSCRFVWNYFLALKKQQYRHHRCWKAYKIGPEHTNPSLTFFSLCKEFTALRNSQEYDWLQEYSFHEVRHSLKYLADAYQAFFKGQRGFPKFKSRYRGNDGFTIPSSVKIKEHMLFVPRIGWLRLKGSNRYADGRPLQARIIQEGTTSRPKWYAYIAYEIPVSMAVQGASTGTLGLDRNVGQATDSNGTVYRMADQSKIAAKAKRKQRLQSRKVRGSVRYRRIGGQLTQLKRKQARIRSNDTHQISRVLADTAHTVVVEKLQTASMTKSAKGTKETPGTNVKAKSGLNRSILATNWGQLKDRLNYKCGQVVEVDPKYTSQTCHQCNHVDSGNRQSQSSFICLACGHSINADWNAAINILGRYERPVARGTGATARREAFPLGTSPTREQATFAQREYPA